MFNTPNSAPDRNVEQLQFVMPSSSNVSPAPKRCPLCGVAMIGRQSHPDSKRLDVFQCLRCETVIDSSANGARNPKSSDE